MRPRNGHGAAKGTNIDAPSWCTCLTGRPNPESGMLPRMIDRHIENLVERLNSTLPTGLQHVQKDLEKNFRSVLQSSFAKMDLVTREEFEVQRGVLVRTREKLEALESRVAELESKLQQ